MKEDDANIVTSILAGNHEVREGGVGPLRGLAAPLRATTLLYFMLVHISKRKPGSIPLHTSFDAGFSELPQCATDYTPFALLAVKMLADRLL